MSSGLRRWIAAAMAAGGIVLSLGWSSWAQERDLLVFAAASLKDALDDVNAQYHRETGRRVTVSYAASPTLAKQIEAAAPADVFISADLTGWTTWRSAR